MGLIFVDLMRKFQKYINWWLMIPSKLYVIINCNSLTIDYMDQLKKTGIHLILMKPQDMNFYCKNKCKKIQDFNTTKNKNLN